MPANPPLEYAYFDDFSEANAHVRETGQPALYGWTDPATGERHYKRAIMRCACGLAEPVSVPIRTEHPCWELELHDDGTFSLSPSIQIVPDMDGYPCRCHFFFKHGEVQKC